MIIIIILFITFIIELRFHPRIDRIGYRRRYILWYDSYLEGKLSRKFIYLSDDK